MMTCWVDDIRFAGLVCQWEGSSELRNRDWVTVKATIAVADHPCYGRTGPVLTGLEVKKAAAPEQEVATFY